MCPYFAHKSSVFDVVSGGVDVSSTEVSKTCLCSPFLAASKAALAAASASAAAFSSATYSSYFAIQSGSTLWYSRISALICDWVVRHFLKPAASRLSST
jgi:hypothetical protein